MEKSIRLTSTYLEPTFKSLVCIAEYVEYQHNIWKLKKKDLSKVLLSIQNSINAFEPDNMDYEALTLLKVCSKLLEQKQSVIQGQITKAENKKKPKVSDKTYNLVKKHFSKFLGGEITYSDYIRIIENEIYPYL